MVGALLLNTCYDQYGFGQRTRTLVQVPRQALYTQLPTGGATASFGAGLVAGRWPTAPALTPKTDGGMRYYEFFAYAPPRRGSTQQIRMHGLNGGLTLNRSGATRPLAVGSTNELGSDKSTTWEAGEQGRDSWLGTVYLVVIRQLEPCRVHYEKGS
jgi:hypothetical protein